MPLIKPGLWSVNPADIDPRYLDLWRGLDIILPFWDSGAAGRHERQWVLPTVNSAPVFQGGALGQGMKFDEIDDYLVYASGEAWTTPDAGQMSVFVSLQIGSKSGTDFQYFLSNGVFSGAGTFHMWFGEGGSDEIAVRMDSQTMGSQNVATSDNQVLNIGFTKNNADGVIYVDGNQLIAESNFADNNISNANMEVGRRADNDPDRFFGGTIFVVYKWNRELSASDMRLLHQDPFGMRRLFNDFPVTAPDPPTQEFLFADSSVSGDADNPSNAHGVADATWTTDLDSEDWTHRWGFDNPTVNDIIDESVDAVLRLTVRHQDGTGNPTIDSVELFDSTGSIVSDATGDTVTSSSGEEITISGLAWTSLTDTSGDSLEVQIVTTAVGGNPAVRSAVQVDEIRLDVTMKAAPSAPVLFERLKMGVGL